MPYISRTMIDFDHGGTSMILVTAGGRHSLDGQIGNKSVTLSQILVNYA
jgi:hypothetical protein